VTSPGGNRKELDSMVVEIELTLCSIIQGVALYFLVDNARLVLSGGQSIAWPYVATGLLIILLFWSRSLIHTLTLIRWPLEFVHNFFYIACALLESLAFTRLADPFMWFVMTALYAILVWGLFFWDRRLVRLRSQDSAGPVGSRLYAMVGADQWLNIVFIIPAIFVFNAGSAFAIYARPEFFLQRQGHLILIALQAIGLLFYLAFVLRAFIKFIPLILATRQEWRTTAENA
jgi:lipoprotein signal peptidase